MTNLNLTSKLRLYSYKSCSTCRKAQKWLADHGIDYQLIDIVNQPPDKKLLKNAISQLGDRKLIVNTSGISYRTLGASVVKSMSDSDFLDALYSDGKLIKRPFLIADSGTILVGFKLEVWKDFFLS